MIIITTLRMLLELGKARLSALVVMTTLAGFFLASRGTVDLQLLGWTAIGTALSAWAANALNQWRERQLDARMKRTMRRPLPAGHISPPVALLLGILAAVWGVMILALAVNLLTAALSALTIVLYVLVYTPMKVASPANTLVGSLCGAIPPLMGWTAASGNIGFGGLVLGLVLFVWQVPHFLGLAWLYREDYELGGFKMLPVVQPEGTSTAAMALVYSLALIPVALLLSISGLSGALYGVAAVLLGSVMVWLSQRFYRQRSKPNARALFLASLVYLPVLLLFMVFNPGPSAFRTEVAAGDSVPLLIEPANAGEPAAQLQSGSRR